MATFRLIHISDLHFSERPNAINPFVRAGGLRWPDIALFRHFKNAVWPSSFSPPLATHLSVYLDSVQQEIDAVVATGDLATTGNEADLKVAKDHFFRDSTEVVESLQSWLRFSSRRDPELPVFLMPGNHDRFQGFRCLPAGKSFEKVFGPSWDAGQGIVRYSSSSVKVVVLTKEREHLVVCLVDFSLKSKRHQTSGFGWLGQGKVYVNVLEELGKLTQRVKRQVANVYIVWAIHFPPQHPNERLELRLIDGKLIGPKAEACGAGLIICGHVHEELIYRIGASSGVQVVCAGSATSVESGSEHALFDLQFDLAKGKLAAGRASKVCYDDINDEFRTYN